MLIKKMGMLSDRTRTLCNATQRGDGTFVVRRNLLPREAANRGTARLTC